MKTEMMDLSVLLLFSLIMTSIMTYALTFFI